MDTEILELSLTEQSSDLSPFHQYEVITLNDQATAGN